MASYESLESLPELISDINKPLNEIINPDINKQLHTALYACGSFQYVFTKHYPFPPNLDEAYVALTDVIDTMLEGEGTKEELKEALIKFNEECEKLKTTGGKSRKRATRRKGKSKRARRNLKKTRRSRGDHVE